MCSPYQIVWRQYFLGCKCIFHSSGGYKLKKFLYKTKNVWLDSGHCATRCYSFLALWSKESTCGFIPWSIEIAQNSSTFHVWSTESTTLRFPTKTIDLSADGYWFIGTYVLIANSEKHWFKLDIQFFSTAVSIYGHMGSFYHLAW